MRIPLIAGNWKMFKTVHEAVVFVKELRGTVKDIEDVEIVVGPAFTALHAAAEAARNSNISVAAQDMHWEREGAFTGEVSAAMILEAGAEHVIIGHSERRRLFGETDVIVNRKVTAAIAAGLTPIMCVGETLEEREAGATEDKVLGQLRHGLAGLSPEAVGTLVIAYEPIWAIGTGRTAMPEDAQAVCATLRAAVAADFGAAAAGTLRIQYGGSVQPGNCAGVLAQPDVDGALVGGASLDPDEFGQIVGIAG
jgi:triosephosphate isomerase